ncbi:MAG: HesA/MoeB/ThiF family protein [Halanaerobiales bacterium]|nr:HesA/MoeB/ThiF family protein [Halanaerobiales bacterium]
MFTELEKTRYARQFILDQWGEETQEKLKNTTVFVAGAGGSGSPIITQLALLGVGKIRICDFDTVDLSNLNRQFLHCVSEESRLGQQKAVSAKKTVHYINPHVEVEIFQEKITADNIDEIVGDAAIIMDSVDKIETKFVLSKCAIRKNIPHLFYGMMDINSFACIFYSPKTPCFHCLYDFNKVKEMLELSKVSQKEDTKTPVCCPPVFLSAGFIMTELVKILLGIGEPAYNKFYLFLQKGNQRVIESNGYMGMRFWNSEFFDEISLNQGFDWNKGWRGNLVEELEIKPNPNCACCSSIDSEEKENDEEEDVTVNIVFKQF